MAKSSTSFKKGVSGNPWGVSRDQHKIHMDNAKTATKLQGLMLEGLLAAVEEAPEEERASVARQYIKDAPLRLIKDAQDRAYGTPTQRHDLNDARDMSEMSDDELLAMIQEEGEMPIGDSDE